jgi:hypothetical protein
VKVENADSHNILNRWKNYFSQLLNARRVTDIRQIEIHTPELLVPDHSSFDVYIAIAYLKRYKGLSKRFSAELIQTGGEIF